VTLDFWATLNDPTRLSDLADLPVPAMVIFGGRSPLPTRRICFHLARKLPNVRLRTIADAGHMLPMTHLKDICELVSMHSAPKNKSTPRNEVDVSTRVYA